MIIIENMSQYAWWLYPSGRSERELAGLWLSTPLGEEQSLIAEMTLALSELNWLLGGTWHSRERGTVQGFSRYPGLAREVLAAAESRSPRGLTTVSEWCVANPDPALLTEYASTVRRSRGKGYSITLAPDGSSRRTWYAATTGANWRSTLALDFEPSGLEFTDRAITACYLDQLASGGLIGVVPLDLHPLSGLALIGGVEQLDWVAQRFPGNMASLGVEEVSKLHREGGGLAL